MVVALEVPAILSTSISERCSVSLSKSSGSRCICVDLLLRGALRACLGCMPVRRHHADLKEINLLYFYSQILFSHYDGRTRRKTTAPTCSTPSSRRSTQTTRPSSRPKRVQAEEVQIVLEAYKLGDSDTENVRDLNAKEFRNDGLESKSIEKACVPSAGGSSTTW